MYHHFLHETFSQGYKEIYNKQLAEVKVQAERMNTGLAKLHEAGESITALSKELEVKEKDLAVANITAQKILEEVCSINFYISFYSYFVISMSYSRSRTLARS